jgi:hypothetical protein
MTQTTAIDDGFVNEQDLIVGTDSRGYSCSSYVLAERLTQIDIALIEQDAGMGDRTMIAEIIGNGFRGYHNMSPGELWSEFKEQEQRFYTMVDTDALPYVFEEDPCNG